MPRLPDEWIPIFTIAIWIGAYLVICWGRDWLIKVIQFTIFVAVVGSNIIWHWAPQYSWAPGLLGLALAYAITCAPAVIQERYQFHQRLRKQWQEEKAQKKSARTASLEPFLGSGLDGQERLSDTANRGTARIPDRLH
jgi:hypothetical protein